MNMDNKRVFCRAPCAVGETLHQFFVAVAAPRPLNPCSSCEARFQRGQAKFQLLGQSTLIFFHLLNFAPINLTTCTRPSCQRKTVQR